MRRDDRARRRRPHRVHAARADRLCRAVLVLHHSDDPRSAAQRSASRILLREVERVAASGFKEIALTGVHLGSYGRDLDPADIAGRASASAARSLTAARAGVRVAIAQVLFRISSLEPMDCSREIVDLVASSPSFAPHFHLPLQHASNRVLSAMRRPYTIEYYSALVDDIRARIPHASIGSDIIVGFPGETDDDFERLVSYLEASPLTHLHVFPYSDRPGTAAATMAGKVQGRDRARARPPSARDRRASDGAFPRFAGRHHASRA